MKLAIWNVDSLVSVCRTSSTALDRPSDHAPLVVEIQDRLVSITAPGY